MVEAASGEEWHADPWRGSLLGCSLSGAWPTLSRSSPWLRRSASPLLQEVRPWLLLAQAFADPAALQSAMSTP